MVTMKFVASSSKKLYQESGLVEDPNKVIGSKRKVIKKKKQDSKVVQELEKEANKPVKKNFKFSKIMRDDLEYYINKYGDDYQAMARDEKNIYQDSPGQIRQKILKYNKIHKVGKSDS